MSGLRLYIHDRHGREISGFLTVQRARRNRACEGYRHTGLHILAGEHYAMQTVYPSSDDFNFVDPDTWRTSRSAVRYRFCMRCAPDAAQELLATHLVGSEAATGPNDQEEEGR